MKRTQSFWMTQATEWFEALLPAEQALYDRFLNLGLETERHFIDAYKPILSFLDPDAYDTVVFPLRHGISTRDGEGWLCPPNPELTAEWQKWEDERAALLDRHPHAALRHVLQEISQKHDWLHQSWPYSYETSLRDWADCGNYDSTPYDADFLKFVPRPIFERMASLRREVKGWWYWDDDRCAPLWVPDAEVSARETRKDCAPGEVTSKNDSRRRPTPVTVIRRRVKGL